MSKKEANITRRRLRSSYITSIISISLVLFMLGMLGLLVLNAKRLSDYVKENIGFSVILKENIKEVDIILLQKSLDASEYVKSTKYITKEEAAEELKQDLGEDFIEFLGFNPLLASIEVHLYANYANTDSIKLIEKDFQQYEQIKEVFYQKSLVTLVNENIRKISLIILVFKMKNIFQLHRLVKKVEHGGYVITEEGLHAAQFIKDSSDYYNNIKKTDKMLERIP